MNIIRPAPNITYTIVGPTIIVLEKVFCPMFINASLDYCKYIYGIGLHPPIRLYDNDDLYEILREGPYLLIGGASFRVIKKDVKYASVLVWRGV